ncbi:enoyl-CoA hydratase/isomerase family protein [Subtercola endophyticus]|uniref:enoyl-CoA hydratase/isomerase family protein n=1 Tax=Subtercola endophyticus TaxID=2895559 RepID=UPI001E5C9B1A|nr:enoyl-CoA hydratase/isomerase family protein [Subtercola endophyticus]UFS58348.1 enoyl-CoA hydratase/isomerase family protein [Subtercola endophyticus]
MHLDKAGSVFILRLDETENRFNVEWVAEFMRLFDTVEAQPGRKALVTAGVGKFWSNGLDLDGVLANPESAGALASVVHEMLARVLSGNLVTIAAIQGHAFAAGAMLALAHDYRVMRADRGYLCLPEVDIKIPFTTGMTALLTSKLTPNVARDAMVTGRRYAAEAALAAGLVDEVSNESELVDRAVELAESLADKDSRTVAAIKSTLYAEPLRALRQSDGNALDLPR